MPSIMNPEYHLLASEADYRQACDTVIGRAQREIAIFDRNLVPLRLNESSRIDKLATFLKTDETRRIRVVIHDPDDLEKNAPRLIQLAARFSHAIAVRQSPDNLRHLADTHLLGDGEHGVRRFQFDLPRCALILDDPSYIGPWRLRFDELWGLSRPCLTLNTTGL
ncbi:hypothetical protein [Sulfuritalea sp.]|uniref:DUF7931 domain-containing protein n=1 Tax=Sulfuritalea sp. TaxID=2480090 RepID=UPI001AD2A6FB|nr:hypothetical protein [Sulfuritalea sp.]MBN8474385.1 hypothetical protein [Sulfuritalea sp.]